MSANAAPIWKHRSESEVQSKESPTSNSASSSWSHGISSYVWGKGRANTLLHKYFPLLGEEEELEQDFYCAMHNKWTQLFHGHLFITKNYICFYSHINRSRAVVIPFSKVKSIAKRKTAIVFPSAIQVNTADKKYFFSQFFHRDAAFGMMEHHLQLQQHDDEDMDNSNNDTNNNQINNNNNINQNDQGNKEEKDKSHRSKKKKKHRKKSKKGHLDIPERHSSDSKIVHISGSPLGASLELPNTFSFSLPADMDDFVLVNSSQDDELAIFLQDLSLSKYLPVFVKEEVDMMFLKNLVDSELELKELLREMEIPAGPRLRIVTQLRKKYSAISEKFQRLEVDSNLNEFEIQFEEIQLGELLGEGFFGEVYKGVWKSKEVAVKKLIRNFHHGSEQGALFREEVSILCQLRHPNILLFIGACFTPPNVCIVTEYCPNGNLYNFLHEDSSDVTLEMRIQIAIGIGQALYYLHTKNQPILHRDLTSHNVLLDASYQVKLADFGLSKHLQPKKMSGKVGNLYWMSPEVFRDENYNESADIYSYAIILFELLTRWVPFNNMDPSEAATLAARNGARPVLPPTKPGSVEELWGALIIKCWDQDASKRPKLDEIMMDLYKMLEMTVSESLQSPKKHSERTQHQPTLELPGAYVLPETT